MSANRVQWSLAVAILALSVFQCVGGYSKLPDPMATNFAGDGTPGAWSSKRSFMAIYAVSMTFWLGGLVAVPWISSRGRRELDEPTRAWLRDTLGWFMVASLVLSAWVTHLVLAANLETGKLGPSFGWALALYMVYVGWWTVRLVQRVRNAPIRSR